MNYIFLSYSHKDIYRVMPFVRLLSEEHRVIYDTNIGAAREYNDEIADMIDCAAIVISFISHNYMSSSYCVDEILYARSKGVAILLVYLEKTELSSGMKLRLGRFQAIELSGAPHLEKIFEIGEIKKCRIETREEMLPADMPKEIRQFNLDDNFYLADLPGNSFVNRGTVGWSECDEWSFLVAAGLCTDAFSQKLEEWEIRFDYRGHYMISGISQSGKSTLAQSILYALMWKYPPSAFQFYIVDMNNYMYECFSKAPHAGVVINDKSRRRIKYLMHLVENMLFERKQLIRCGDIIQYNSIHGGRLPAILLLIDDVEEMMAELNQEQSEILLRVLRDGARYGIYLLVINESSIKAPYSNASVRQIVGEIRNHISFEQKHNEVIAEYLGVRREDVEIAIPQNWGVGKGVYNFERKVLRIKAALPIEADNIYVREQLIEKTCEDMRTAWKGPGARELHDVPEELDRQSFFERSQVKEAFKKKNFLPIGLYLEDAEVAGIELDCLYTFLIVGRTNTETYQCMRTFLESAIKKNAEIYYIDSIGREMLRIAKEHVHYANNRSTLTKEMLDYFTPMIKERNDVKRNALKQGKSNEQIVEIMKQFCPVFMFIEDLKEFLDMIYEENDSENLRGFMETIWSKGQYHNFYIVAATTVHKKRVLTDCILKERIIMEDQGMVVGDKLADQDFFDFPEVAFKERGRSLKHGEGLMCNSGMSRIIKIPL